MIAQNSTAVAGNRMEVFTIAKSDGSKLKTMYLAQNTGVMLWKTILSWL